MAYDPLAALHRLRGLEVLEARRVLADGLAAARQAEAAAAEAAARLEVEAAVAGASPGGAADYARWAPVGRAARDHHGAEQARAAATVEVSQATLADTRAAENAVEKLLDLRREIAAATAARRRQALLDEIGIRRPR